MRLPQTFKAVKVDKPLDDVFKAAALVEQPLPALTAGQVLIKMLAAPINPSDLMTIRGKYDYVTEYPRVVGFEGVAEVVETGNDVTGVEVGDRVMMKTLDGSWRDYGVFDQDSVIKIDKNIPIKTAATMFINNTTAYFLVKESGLESGQTLIQNGANSMVGKAVIQIAKSMGIKTINVVRNRANLAELVAELKELGADDVITDDQLKEGKLGVKVPLAIDCVAGEAGALLMRYLEDGGTLVNYGALSDKPIPASPNDFMFKNLKIKGYHLQRSVQGAEDLMKAFAFTGKLMKEGKLKLPEFELVKFEDYQKGLERMVTGYSNKKQLLVMNDTEL